MAHFRLRSRTAPILPLVLSCVVVVEEISTYKLREHVPDARWRAAGILAFYGIAFALAASKLEPWLTRLLGKLRTGSKRRAGTIGLWMFYVAAYGALYLAFYVMETHGVRGLLPASLR